MTSFPHQRGVVAPSLPGPSFYANQVLAACLGSSSLAKFLSTNRTADLPSAFRQLSPSQSDEITTSLDQPALQELFHLSVEDDAGIFYEDLFTFATHQEQSGNLALAARIYSAVSTQENRTDLQQRAQARVDVLQGHGSMGLRSEFLLRSLAQESCEPTTLLAMGTAGALFQVTRLGLLSRLTASPSANFFTRGIEARALASIGAFSVEAPTFALTGHLAGAAFGRNQDWNHLGREIASGYLLLGGLRLVGCTTRTVAASLYSPVASGSFRPLQAAISQAGMLGGILLGRRLEETFGLREHHAGSSPLVDSLALLLQFHVAGRLTQQVFGARFLAWERGLEIQTAVLSRPFRFPWRNADPPPDAALVPSADVEPVISRVNSSRFRPPQWMIMMSGSGEGGEGPPLTGPTPLKTIVEPESPRTAAAPETSAPESGKVWEFPSLLEITRNLSQPDSPIVEALRSTDLHFRVRGDPFAKRLASFGENLVKFLNSQTTGFNFGSGRKVRVEIPASEGEKADSILVSWNHKLQAFELLPGMRESSITRRLPTVPGEAHSGTGNVERARTTGTHSMPSEAQLSLLNPRARNPMKQRGRFRAVQLPAEPEPAPEPPKAEGLFGRVLSALRGKDSEATGPLPQTLRTQLIGMTYGFSEKISKGEAELDLNLRLAIGQTEAVASFLGEHFSKVTAGTNLPLGRRVIVKFHSPRGEERLVFIQGIRGFELQAPGDT